MTRGTHGTVASTVKWVECTRITLQWVGITDTRAVMTLWTHNSIELSGTKVSSGTWTTAFRTDGTTGTEESIKATLRSTEILWNRNL